MSNNFTITLSLGSGRKAEALARQIKSWAGSTPISEAIRNLIKKELRVKDKPVTPKNINAAVDYLRRY
jgi:hypothetical protein